MPKMHYFSNKFSKIAKHCGLTAPQRPLIFNIGDLNYVIWLNCGFSSWLWRNRTSKNQLWCHFCDIIAITSAKWRHQNNVPKIFHFGPPFSIKISGYASALMFMRLAKDAHPLYLYPSPLASVPLASQQSHTHWPVTWCQSHQDVCHFQSVLFLTVGTDPPFLGLGFLQT